MVDVNAGFKRLIEISKSLPEEYQRRIQDELDVIIENPQENLMSYFMILADVFAFCRSKNITVSPGRGSSSGSLIAFLLGITQEDPIKHDLPFSRFLSFARIAKGSLPDIDCDFPRSRRKEVVDYILTKYGDRAAHVATFTMLKLKNALLDSFRTTVTQPYNFQIKQAQAANDANTVLRLTAELNQATKRFEDVRKSIGNAPPGIEDDEWLDGYELEGGLYPGLLESNDAFRNWTLDYPEVFSKARKILGLPRNISVHAGGIVIAPVPLWSIVPVLKIEGVNVVSYNKKTIPKVGLIKFDILGITTLDYIEHSINLIKNRHKIEIEPWEIEYDADCYKAYLDNKCLSIFQCTTTSAAAFMKRIKANTHEEVSAAVALNRPGALNAVVEVEIDGERTEIAAADAYIYRKNGIAPIEYLHPDLEPLLNKTYSIITYQEQVMAILHKIAGFTEEEADSIRGSISDKDPRAFEQVTERLQKLIGNGWTKDQVDKLSQQIQAFAAYGFCKAHAFAYGRISNTTAWLKYHYPLEWWCGVLSHCDADKISNEYWLDAQKYVTIPNVNLSGDKFTIVGDKLVPPLSLIDGIGDKGKDEITKNAPFTDLEDLLKRCSGRAVTKKVLYALLKAGALDVLLSKDLTTLADKSMTLINAIKQHKDKKVEMPEEFKNLTPYKEYLLTKAALSIAPISLSEIIDKSDSISKPFLTVSEFNSDSEEITFKALRGQQILVNGPGLANLVNDIPYLKERSVSVCCYGYVKDYRKFSYKNKTKTAVDLLIDFDGYNVKNVIWPRGSDAISPVANRIKQNECYLFIVKIDKNENFRFTITSAYPVTEKNK